MDLIEKARMTERETDALFEGIIQTEEGFKLDEDKLRYDLVPSEALQEVVKVLTMGAKKYSDDNWKHVPDLQQRYYAACMRHLEAHRQKYISDSESGLSHLAHAICCLFFMLQNELEDVLDVKQEMEDDFRTNPISR